MADPAPVPKTLISLRPAGQHDSLRHAAARHGLGLVAVSPWRLRERDDDATRADLAQALAAPAVVFTSPAAVRAAAGLADLHRIQSPHWLAVGEGTARALARAGIAHVQQPARMDSEGLLALPALAQVPRIGLVTAPGGRGLIAAELARRGVEVVRADVYERLALPLAPALLRRLRELPAPWVLAVSSGEAFERVLAALPADIATAWRGQQVVVASARLATQVRAHGFPHVLQAAGPRPAQLIAALAPPVGPG